MAEDVGTIFYTVDAKTDPLVTASGKADKAVQDIVSALNSADKAADSASKGLDSAGKSLNNAGQKMGDVASKAKAAGDSVKRFGSDLNDIQGDSSRGIADAADSIKNAAEASNDANDPIKELVENMNQGAASAGALTFSMSALATAIASIVFSNTLKTIAEMVQKYEEMADRVLLASRSQEEYEMVQRRLLTTANGTYRSLQEAQELYITTANSLRSLGYSTNQALDVTDSMSYAFVRNATTADKAQGAIDAFSKSVNTGKVAADQWETLSGAIPSVIDDIAKSAGKTGAEIRKMGAEGKITATQLTEGLRKALESNTQAAAKMSTNLIDAATRSKTAFTAFFVAVEKQTGILATLTNGIIMAADDLLKFSAVTENVSETINAASSAAAILATVIVSKLVGSLASYTTAQGTALVAAIRRIDADRLAANMALMVARANVAAAESAVLAARAAEAAAVGFAHHAQMAAALAAAEGRALAATVALDAALAAAAGTATRASVAMAGLQRVMGFLGGPVGVILIAAAALYYFAKAARDTVVDVDQLNSSLKTLSYNQLSKSANDLGDDITKLNKQLSNSYQELNTMTKRFYEDDGDFVKRQTEQKAAIDGINQELKKRRDALAAVTAQQDEMTKGWRTPKSAPGAPVDAKPVLPDDPDAEKAIKALEDERDLLKVVGDKRAELRALQKAGDGASDAQKKKIQELAKEIYDLEEAEKKRNAASTKGAKQAEKDTERLKKQIQGLKAEVEQVGMNARDASIAKAVEQLNGLGTPAQVAQVKELAAAAFDANQAKKAAEAVKQLKEQINQVGASAKELAQRQAEIGLGEFATPDQIARIRELAGELQMLEERKNLTTQLQTDVPQLGAAAKYEEDLKRYAQYKEQELITDQTYADLKAQREREYEEQKRALQEETFRRASVANEALMAGLDALGQAGTQAISGLLTGSSSLQEAFASVANTVLNSVIGSFVEMGIQYVKSIIIGQTAQSAAAAAAVISGTAIAAAYAPAAAMASLASFGANAGPAATAITGTVGLAKGLSLAGGRAAGGPVAAGSMYRVNEGGKPEVFTAGGQQYMIPNQRGEVVSNKKASAAAGQDGGMPAAPIVNIYEAPAGTQANARFSEADNRYIIDVVYGDMVSGGKTGKATNAITGTKRAGS